MAELLVGHAREKITPEKPVHMMGYAARKEVSQGVHDDLWVNAVALAERDAETIKGKIVLLALDVAALDLDKVARLKEVISAEAGLGAAQILVNTSHTHAGPMVAERPGLVFEAAYFEEMVQRASLAVQGALGDLHSAELAVGAASVDIGCNRRARTPEGQVVIGVNPEGPRLAEVTIWRFSRQQAPDILLFSLPIHGTVLGADNLFLSAEWMGAAVRKIEEALPGVRAIFLQGCAGDQNPYREERTFSRVEEHGEAVSRAVQEALPRLEKVVPLPLVNVAKSMLLPLAGGGVQPVPIHGFRLGEALCVGLGGEAFVEYALYTREQAQAKSTLVLGYTDGSVTYLPTENAFLEGGYEPNAYQYFPIGRPWDPNIEQIIKEEIADLLMRLHD
ncbi:MAG: neutral/alkaline non-lysosomal ceramidase N-terminal domain-containing protein [Anaerolineae bacterium]|nr:neutral/alkaline non-lysosomal ceramidase N-terminal domain-containing protein [Anaerolineae bacterium]